MESPRLPGPPARRGIARPCRGGRRPARRGGPRAGPPLPSAPEPSLHVERLLGLEATTHLPQAALEVLAIVAYQQPVTRPHIDSIRGVNSERVLGPLLR